jgi:hypothetical protein
MRPEPPRTECITSTVDCSGYESESAASESAFNDPLNRATAATSTIGHYGLPTAAIAGSKGDVRQGRHAEVHNVEDSLLQASAYVAWDAVPRDAAIPDV